MNLREAVKILKNGGVVAYPTDTAYGLGADPANKKAVAKIFKIKGRERSKSLPLIAGSFKMARKYAKFDKISLSLANKHWPGPLTLVLEPTALAKDTLSKLIFQNKKIAVRVPDFPKFQKNKAGDNIGRKLSTGLGRPITSTSANISGEPMCYSARQIERQFKERKFKPDFIISQSGIRKSRASTIIEVDGGIVKVLREGRIKIVNGR